jgi:hypothetical protein
MSVHPGNQPISHSVNAGFKRRPELLGDASPVSLGAWRERKPFVGTASLGVPSFQSRVVGVPHALETSRKFLNPLNPLLYVLLFASGVGHFVSA